MISSKHKQILEKVKNKAINLDDIGFQTRILAAVVYKNKVVSIASNLKKTHTFQKKFSKNEFAIYLHAETHAIKNAIKVVGAEKIKKCELFVVRFAHIKSKHGKKVIDYKLANSEPCSGCKTCINKYGIKRVLYSVEDGFKAF